MAVKPTPHPQPYFEQLHRRQGGLSGILDSIINGGGDANNSDGDASNGGNSGGDGGNTGGNGNGNGSETSTPSTTAGADTSTTPTSTPTSTTPSTTQTPTPTSTRTSSVAQTSTQSVTGADGVVSVTTFTTNSQVVITESSTPTQTASTGSSTNGALIGGVVGGVVGGLALLTLLALILFLWRRRKSRTGHGWFLCFGRRPGHNGEYDTDWPTFDPSAGAAGAAGGAFGAGAAGAGNRQSGTLPDVDDAYDHNGASYRNAGSVGESGGGYYDANNYMSSDEMQYAAAAGGMGAGAAGAASYLSPTSDGTHYRQSSQQWHPSGMTSFSHNGTTSDAQRQPSVPDYSHLDAPEVREQRAREQAHEQAQAQAMAAAAAAGGFSHQSASSPSSPPMHYGSPVGSAPNSPPPQQRPMSSDHRLSQGTAQMLADNNYFLSNEEDELHDGTGTAFQRNSSQRLQVHNPDA